MRHRVVEPCDVWAVRSGVRGRREAVDACEILQRLANDTETVRVECCPECATEDCELGGDIVARPV